MRRCAERWADGRFVLEQETNAYAVLPESQWRGYRPPAEPPGPAPGTWGDPPPMLSAVAQAALEGDLAGKVQALAADPKDGLAAALARLGRAFMARELREFYRSAADAEKHSPELNHTTDSRFRTGRSKKGRRIEEEAVGAGCAECPRLSGPTGASRRRLHRPNRVAYGPVGQ